MNKRTPRILFALVFVAVIGAAILNWPAVYGLLIDPIARVFWLLIRLLMMVDQEVYWILLIFAGFTLAALMVPNPREGYDRAYKGKSSPSSDRVGSWKSLIESARDDPASRAALQRRLEDLYNTINSLVDGDDPENICVFPEKSAYRQGSMTNFVRQSLRRWLPRRNEIIDPTLIERVDQIITSLETSLEIRDDKPIESNDRN